MTTPTIPDLLSKVEGAKEGSRLLDAEIYAALGFQTRRSGLSGDWFFFMEKAPGWRAIPEVSQSADAALGLIDRMRPGGAYSISREGAENFYATVGVYGEGRARSWTPALALCTALLRAIQAKDEQHG